MGHFDLTRKESFSVFDRDSQSKKLIGSKDNISSCTSFSYAAPKTDLNKMPSTCWCGISAPLGGLLAGLLKYNPSLSSTSTPLRESTKRAALWERNARFALPIPTPVWRKEKRNIGSNLMLIHINTYRVHTRLTEQCSTHCQRLSHSAVMGQFDGSQFGLFLALRRKQEGAVRGPGKTFLDQN